MGFIGRIAKHRKNALRNCDGNWVACSALTLTTPPPPLTLASSYTAVPANFAEPGWEQKLRDAGHDGRQPPVWVLEGLLYYLAPDAVQRNRSA